MERMTIRVPEPQSEEIDQLIERGIYQNRSEFVREAVRELLWECPDASDAAAEAQIPSERYGTRLPGGDD